MNKGELVDKLAVRLGDKKVATRAVDDLLDIINRAIAKGEKVSITGFGTFEKVSRSARTARNPRTGETVKLRKTSVPKFRPGAHLRGVASGLVKLGREPKPEPLLPQGVTSVRARKALEEISATPAAPVTTPVKAAAGTAKRTPAAAKTAAKKVTGSSDAVTKRAAAKRAPAKKTATKQAAAAQTKTTKATTSRATAKKSAAKTSTRKATAKKA